LKERNWRTIIQGIENSYSRHEGQLLKAWRASIHDLGRPIYFIFDFKYIKGI
jgi:hypothetical protein